MADSSRPLRLQIHVQPRATRNRIVGPWQSGLKVQIQAPPIEGAANAALIELLADALGVPRRAVQIVRGAGSREKWIEIHTSDPVACQQRLQDLLDGVRVDKRKARH